jgi:hypothetical protein
MKQIHARFPFQVVADDRPAQNCKQPVVELLKLLIDWLLRPVEQMRRDPFCLPLELSLMQETQPWRQESNDGRGFFMDFGSKRGRRPRGQTAAYMAIDVSNIVCALIERA